MHLCTHMWSDSNYRIFSSLHSADEFNKRKPWSLQSLITLSDQYTCKYVPAESTASCPQSAGDFDVMDKKEGKKPVVAKVILWNNDDNMRVLSWIKYDLRNLINYNFL